MAVKWRFFQSLPGGCDPEAERIYRWHIERRVRHRWNAGLPMDGWKRSTDDYVTAAEHLFLSMLTRGFDLSCPVPVDPDGHILGGAHRIACALALEIDEIPVLECLERVWAPAWDFEWFIREGMGDEDLTRLVRDFEACRQA